MLIVKNKRYVKKHVIGGSGFFDSISNLFKRLISSNASRRVVSNLSRAAASDIGKTAINAAKTVGKELSTSAINAAKDVAIERGKQFITNKTDKFILSQNSKDILDSLISTAASSSALPGEAAEASSRGATGAASSSEAAVNINKLMMGQAIRIQDLVKGSGLRLA
jgi:hypothetical protein